MTTFEIRPFMEADQNAVVSLGRQCGLVVPWNDPVKDIKRKLAVQRELFLVATVNDDIVGSVMAGYEGHRGWINYLAVAPDQRRSGCGRQLMKTAEHHLRELGCPKINLQVRSTNSQVIEFYEAVGFTRDDVVSLGKRLEPDT